MTDETLLLAAPLLGASALDDRGFVATSAAEPFDDLQERAMKHWDARKKAEEIQANAAAMNASSGHADSERQAAIAAMVIDLSNQLEQYEPTPTEPAAEPVTPDPVTEDIVAPVEPEPVETSPRRRRSTT